MHGSLNWFQCTNAKCPGSSLIDFDVDPQRALYRAAGLAEPRPCSRCASEMIPLLIPPLLKKPIGDNWITRAIWGLAKRSLSSASKVVIVGFSAAETDFSARWLLRSAVGTRSDVEVFVVNPQNGEPEFRQRMNEIFLRGWSTKFREFKEISNILSEIGRPAA